MGSPPAEIFAQRMMLTEEMIAEGTRYWQAYSSTDPNDVNALFHQPSRILQRAHHVFFGHVIRYPSLHNGLNHIETLMLADLNEPAPFPYLLRRMGESGVHFGYGDYQLWHDLLPLATAQHPLIEITGAGDPLTAIARKTIGDAIFSRTEVGTSILKGEADMVKLNGADRWLGGTHLQSAVMDWRWERSNVRLVALGEQTAADE